MMLIACARESLTPELELAELLTAQCTVTDGDTLRCGTERVRLLAIDAPEIAGHCRPQRTCVDGDPRAASAALETAIAGKPLTIARFDPDRYGRTLAIVYAGGISTSCSQLSGGHAVFVPRWDKGGRVARECGIVR